MEYIWIGMLLGIDAIWCISSIADVVSTVEVEKNNRQNNNIADFIKCIVEELDDSTLYCIALHITALFLYIWAMDKLGGVE